MPFSPQFAGAWLTVCWRDSEHAKVAETFSSYMEACARETPEMRELSALRWLYNNAIREEFYVLSAVTAARIPKRGMSARLKALARDRMRCAYCGNTNATTVDHVVPLSQGGEREDLLNVVAACEECNQKKGNRTPEEAHMRLLWQPYWLEFPSYNELNKLVRPSRKEKVSTPSTQAPTSPVRKRNIVSFYPKRAGDWLSVCWRDLNEENLVTDFVTYFRASGLRRRPHEERVEAAEKWLAINYLDGDWYHRVTVMEAMTIRNGSLRLKSKVLARDKFRCAYCGENTASTTDHVMPVSRDGDKTSLLNVVAACASCNTRKADRTPEEAGMPLLWEPYLIDFPHLF